MKQRILLILMATMIFGLQSKASYAAWYNPWDWFFDGKSDTNSGGGTVDPNSVSQINADTAASKEQTKAIKAQTEALADQASALNAQAEAEHNRRVQADRLSKIQAGDDDPVPPPAPSSDSGNEGLYRKIVPEGSGRVWGWGLAIGLGVGAIAAIPWGPGEAYIFIIGGLLAGAVIAFAISHL